MNCDDLRMILERGRACEETPLGARVATHCLYPSADIVHVHVARWGDGFRVTDGGGVSRSVFVHGHDTVALRAGLDEARRRHGVSIEGAQLVAEVNSEDWLPAAVAAVANGAALAANVAIEHVTKKTERDVADRILEALERIVPLHRIAREHEWRGHSGKLWRVDFAVLGGDRPVLIKEVSPHPSSISANYTAYGDIGNSALDRLCVFSRPLPRPDAALLRQVATLVPVASVAHGVKQALRTAH